MHKAPTHNSGAEVKTDKKSFKVIQYRTLDRKQYAQQSWSIFNFLAIITLTNNFAVQKVSHFPIAIAFQKPDKKQIKRHTISTVISAC